MRYLTITILLNACFLTAAAQTNQRTGIDTVDFKHLVPQREPQVIGSGAELTQFYHFNDEPFTGLARKLTYRANGTVLETVLMKFMEGNQHGTTTIINSRRSRQVYKKGLLVKSNVWYLNGRKLASLKYKNGVLYMKRTYTEEGASRLEQTDLNTGRITLTWFHSNGQKLKQGCQIKSMQGVLLLDGKWTYWDQKGKKTRTEIWDAGALIGTEKEKT